MKQELDVLIVGAGMAGATLAALLSREPGTRDLRIGIVDSGKPVTFDATAPIGLRVSALSRASQNILMAAGAWQDIAAQRVCAYREMRVWDARPGDVDDPGSDGLHFDAAELGEPDLGHIVENDLVQWSLQRVLAANPGIKIIQPATLSDARRKADHFEVDVKGHGRFATRLLVGCDGAQSRVRKLADIEVDRASYAQRGIVAVVRTSQSHRETAWQRFLPTGPIAFLPLANGECSLVWSCADAMARDLSALDDAGFAVAVKAASNGMLGDVQVQSRRASFELQRLHARAYCRAGVALAGDAAHVVHPLAGQGANLGMLDAAALVEVLSQALAAGEGPGDLRVLRRYERWRKGDNLAMLVALDSLSKIFAVESGPLGLARRAGMAAVNVSPPAKNRLARHALGLGGEIPGTARGSPGATEHKDFA